MPTPTPRPSAGRPSRRAVLAGALALAGGALSACTADPATDGARRGRPAEPEVDPDVALAARALGDVRRTLEVVEATAEQHPRLRGILSTVRAVHEQHVDFLAGAVPTGAPSPTTGAPSPTSSAPSPTSGAPSPTSGAPSPSVGPSPGASRAGVPRNRERALAAVVRAEQLLAAAMTTHALAARSGAFARALGSIGAAAAQQATALPAGGLDSAGGPR